MDGDRDGAMLVRVKGGGLVCLHDIDEWEKDERDETWCIYSSSTHFLIQLIHKIIITAIHNGLIIVFSRLSSCSSPLLAVCVSLMMATDDRAGPSNEQFV